MIGMENQSMNGIMINCMIDCIFFKVYQFFERHEKGGDSTWSASLYISTVEFLIVYSVFMMLDIFSGKKITNTNFIKNNYIIICIIIILIILIIYKINILYFNKNKEKIIKKYKNTKYHKGFMFIIGALILILFLSPILWNEIYKLIK